MENLVYLIHDKNSGRAAIVDPAWEVSKILDLAERKGAKITDILLTHSHNDHINGIDRVLRDHDAQIHLLKAEADFSSQFSQAKCTHHGGDQIKLGDTVIDVLHTPGHTPGSACYKIEDKLIAGDTLFVFGCGRCDLAGGDPHQMFHTLKKLESDLPRQTIVLPGHHYAEKQTCTMAEQSEGNPFLHFEDENSFTRYRMIEHDKTRHSPYQPVKK